MMSSTAVVIKKTEEEKSQQNMLRPDVPAERLYNAAEETAFDLDAQLAAWEHATDKSILRAEREANDVIDRRNAQQQQQMNHTIQEMNHGLDVVSHDLELEELRQQRKIQIAGRRQFCNPRAVSPLILPAVVDHAPFTESEIKMVRDHLDAISHYTTDERLKQNIDNLRCPISGEIMRWPVVMDQDPLVCDKYSLMNMLAKGHNKSPQSRATFKEADLKTNHFVVTLLQGFLTEAYRAKEVFSP